MQFLSFLNFHQLKSKSLNIVILILCFNFNALALKPTCENVFENKHKATTILDSESELRNLIQQRQIGLNTIKTTRIEAQLASKKVAQISINEQLFNDLQMIKNSNLNLYQKIKNAIELKAKHKSISIDLAILPAHMQYFLTGAWEKVLGKRGLSLPFIEFTAINENQLVIKQLDDQFPILVTWNKDILTPRSGRITKIGNENYLELMLPMTMKGKSELRTLSKSLIFSLISGSSLNRYLSNENSIIGRLTSIIHDGKLQFDRPTQVEAKEVTQLLNSQLDLRKAIRSLLFIAPTASGKTKVIVDRIADKAKTAITLLNEKNQYPSVKKLTILMTKTTDLTSELAVNVGKQLRHEIGDSFRIIQWGGEYSEQMTVAELIKFISDSNKPVLLVTSYPTVAARTKDLNEKKKLISLANSIIIDEAHNATGETFEQVLKVAHEQAAVDRTQSDLRQALDIFGVTASPITRGLRTIESFDSSFWAGIDQPQHWAKIILKSKYDKRNIIDWVRVLQQYHIARDRGEIAAADPIFYKADERGFSFSSLFQRSEKGTQSSVNLNRLKTIWPDIDSLIQGHGPGVIHTYHRDADGIAETLSQLTQKNFVSIENVSANARLEIYAAFRQRSEYKGKVIDAIVGQIREGLDFPMAGWYLSFKKYVRFPENIQGPGRVVRIAQDKPTPVIIFFGEEINKIAYEKVRELVLAKIGKLPYALKDAHLYSGARKAIGSQSLIQAIDNTNLAIEALLRKESKLSQMLGRKGELNPEAIQEIQKVIQVSRTNHLAREIDLSIDSLVTELMSFPFYNGQLASTWKECDRILQLAKKIEKNEQLPRTVTQNELDILNNSVYLDKVKQFRSLYSMLGVLPREILSTMTLVPTSIQELINAVNKSIEVNQGVLSLNENSAFSLIKMTELAVKTSPDSVWRGLSHPARKQLAYLFPEFKQINLESALQQYFDQHQQLPKSNFELIEQSHTVIENLGARIHEELELRLKNGDLDLNGLSPELIKAIDQSSELNHLAIEVFNALEKIKVEVGETEFKQAHLTINDLKNIKGFAVIQTMEQLSSNGNEYAKKYLNTIEQILAGVEK